MRTKGFDAPTLLNLGAAYEVVLNNKKNTPFEYFNTFLK